MIGDPMPKLLLILLAWAAATTVTVEPVAESALECPARATGSECMESQIELVEDQEASLLRVELLQQAKQQVTIKRGALASASADGGGFSTSGRVEFNISHAEFGNVTAFILQRLKAAGVPMADFAPRFLLMANATGAELEAEPTDEDFPLLFAYEPRAGSLRQQAEQGKSPDKFISRRRRTHEPESTTYTSSPEEVDMQTLANNVYDFQLPDPKCWKRIVSKSFSHSVWGGQDNVAIYSCQCDPCMTTPSGTGMSTDASLLAVGGSKDTAAIEQGGNVSKKAEACTLAISGSNDLLDWAENIDVIWDSEFCGHNKYHSGFADEATSIVGQPEFADLAAHLKTCDRLVVVGHSLGGAVASLFAECINCQDDCRKPPALAGIGAEAELYTFGAPAVFDGDPPKNGRAGDGVFKGRRFWNYDMRSCIHRWCAKWCCWSLGNQDPVPYVAQKIGYKHPKIEAVGLDEHGEVEVWSASSDTGPIEPDSFQLPSPLEHLNINYLSRIKMHLKG